MENQLGMPAAKLIPGPCREELLAGAGTIEEIHIHWRRCYRRQREGKKHSGFSLPPTFQTLNSASHWLDLGGQAGKGAWDLSSVGIAHTPPPNVIQSRAKIMKCNMLQKTTTGIQYQHFVQSQPKSRGANMATRM